MPRVKQFFSASVIAECVFLQLSRSKAKNFRFHQKHACERIATSKLEFSQTVF